MYKTKQYVNHRFSGVCIVKDIAPLLSHPEGPLYYVLEPLFGEDKGSLVKVPVTNLTSLKPLPSKKEVISLLREIKKTKNSLYISDTKLRKTTFETVIGCGELAQLIPLYNGVKEKKEIDGKLNSMDNQFLKKAEPLIFGNVSIAVGIPYESVAEFYSSL